jgi:hypothetical protein
MRRLLAILIFLGGAVAVASATPVVANIRSFGAIGDGVVDDRPAITAAIAAAGPGGIVYVPNGTYRTTQNPGHYWDFYPLPGQTFLGETRDSAIIRMASGQGQAVQMFWVQDAPDVSFSTLTLDGNKSAQSVDPHRAGIFVKNSPRVTLRNVTAQNFTGDGAEIYAGSDDPTVYGSIFVSNDRNGLTLGGSTTGGMFTHNAFISNAAQQFDSEGNPVNSVTLTNNLFDGLGASGDYVLTMTGMGAGDLLSHNWTVTDNTINGGALMVWVTDVVFARNVGTNATNKPHIRVYRTTDHIRIQDNWMTTTYPGSFDEAAMIYVTGTGLGQSPAGVVISGNKMTSYAPNNGVTVIGANDVVIEDNTFVGTGVAQNWQAGVFLRAVKTDVPLVSAIVARNTISDFGDMGIRLGGSGSGSTAAHLLVVSITDNTFSSSTSAMVRAMYLGDDPATARKVTQAGNTISGGTSVLVSHPPGGVSQPWGDGTRWTAP